MGEFIWWEEMIYPGGELSTAIMGHGTLSALMAGIQLEKKQELSVKQLDNSPLTIVILIIKNTT